MRALVLILKFELIEMNPVEIAKFSHTIGFLDFIGKFGK